MSTKEQTHMERALALRFSEDAARLRRLADRAADHGAGLASRSEALADIGDWLDHVSGHPEMDTPTANLVESVFVGLIEALCPELIDDVRTLWTRDPIAPAPEALPMN
jgi:hypothetical protein